MDVFYCFVCVSLGICLGIFLAIEYLGKGDEKMMKRHEIKDEEVPLPEDISVASLIFMMAEEIETSPTTILMIVEKEDDEE